MQKNTGILHSEYWDSPFGKVTVSCSEKGVCQLRLSFLSKTGNNGNGSLHSVKAGRTAKDAAARKSAVLARRAVAELRQYARGDRMQFTVPLDLRGTPFQMKVWNALLRIPYGETRSYQEIAQEIGNRRASRAVGMANHWNPVAIMVPCHRVIASDGSLGGYAGGLQKKAQMLSLEKSHLS